MKSHEMFIVSKKNQSKKTHRECTETGPDGAREYFGCAGGGYDYCFTPTGLGMLAEVRCACGAKIDMDNI